MMIQSQLQKLMIDEKKCYFFGRNKTMCDFCIDHASCSRVHAALVWHKHLNRPFIIDLGSTHGTFIGTIRLELNKPQQVPLDSELHFGASTRIYIIRERPNTIAPTVPSDDKMGDELEGGLLGLPETETELDNLTEFNTAHNRRTALADMTDPSPNPLKRRRKSTKVIFNDEEDVINPEDIDPSVGRFRNLISTTVIPSKKPRMDGGMPGSSIDPSAKRQPFGGYGAQLYEHEGPDQHLSGGSFSFASKIGLKLPNLAPDVEMAPIPSLPVVAPAPMELPVSEQPGPNEPKKKKYAKEAWPGKKPTPALFPV